MVEVVVSLPIIPNGVINFSKSASGYKKALYPNDSIELHKFYLKNAVPMKIFRFFING